MQPTFEHRSKVRLSEQNTKENNHFLCIFEREYLRACSKVQFIYDNSDNLDNYFILFRHKRSATQGDACYQRDART